MFGNGDGPVPVVVVALFGVTDEDACEALLDPAALDAVTVKV